MIGRKFLNIVFSLLLLTSLFLGGMGKTQIVTAASAQNVAAASAQTAAAAPTSPTDESKVPHYFGPSPNWANSPYTLPDVSVSISGDGTGAMAVASVGADGAITGVTITDPGSGYTAATVDFVSTNGSGASADAVINPGGVVSSVRIDAGGSGYTAPLVIFEVLGEVAPATATAYGGVDAVTLDLNGAGVGYSMPTVDFDMPDAPDGVQARAHADFDPTTGAITAIVVDQPGSGYSAAPNVVIRDGTIFDPINHDPGTFTAASASATLTIQNVVVNTYGDSYPSTPQVWIEDTLNVGTGSGAMATAFTDIGAITGIANLFGGTGYVTTGGIKKFQDGLPKLCIPSANFSECATQANNLGQYLPIAVADTTTFSTTNGLFDLDADYYVIALVQHREQMHSDLPPTLLREYVQLETSVNASWSRSVPLYNDLLDGTSVPAMMPDGVTQAVAVDDPHFLGPVIVAQKDRPVRIVFYNLLPTGSGGDLFLPTDSTIMGSGMAPNGMMDPMDEGTVMDGVRNPVCNEYPKSMDCFKDNRATLHLHGGITPWISDGTPHQWITPANENTSWPEGVSVEAVPDMSNVPGVPNCSAPDDGCMTFYYTNQQSARFMFYHDHAWGITRLNVYAGEAAGYVITDQTEQALMAPGGPLAEVGLGIPLVIQDRTFVPSNAQLYGDPANGVYGQDPTWDASRWGGEGNLWYHHVYMPAQNPGDPSGMSAYGRWMYGPWFWPPATPAHGPIANPYYNMDPATGFTTPLAVPCSLDDPSTWQYQTDPFCEPEWIPGTPNISAGMEQFNDTPIVNGTAYPTTDVDPKAYRFRILNAANDRFWNLQWYVADSTGTEVALNPAELAAAQIDPNIFPTPDTSVSPVGPSWIQIGTEGGFLPAPVVVPNQPITWIIDPTRFDVGNVDKHSLLLAPAERADVIVDFSKFAGQTLILYNDAPAAFPARVSSYDYYTGAPDLSPVGAPTILPGYGPNTRTIMQIHVATARADGQPIAAYDLAKLNAAFRHHADGSGVFESGQHPIIVGQAAYNSAYGTSFSGNSWCNAPGSTLTRCDGFLRISEQGGDLFGFNTLKSQNTKLAIKLEPKAIHDEMNASAFDEFGRMTANLGVEAVPATPAGQNITLYPYVNPQTELIDATNLPTNDINMTPVSAISSADGTQIWKITHNGVDTHPIHWHLYDVQLLNRVTWDNIIIPPDASELGWKDTIRISPLEDTIVALRPIIPYIPFELPNSIRPLNPMMPLGSGVGFNNVDANGNPTNPIVNSLVNFGWEYVFHCHILSHEEMDMMRPVSVALPPKQADGLSASVSQNGPNMVVHLSWNDNSVAETAYVVQRSADGGASWVDVGTIVSPLDVLNTAGSVLTFDDATVDQDTIYLYQIVAQNTIGYGAEFMSMTVQSISASASVGVPAAAPESLAATFQPATGNPTWQQPTILLSWTDNATNESGFIIERSTDGVNFVQIATAPANAGIGPATFVDMTDRLSPNATYTYQVAAIGPNTGSSPYSNQAAVTTPDFPQFPTILTIVGNRVGGGNNDRVTLTWTDVALETGYTIQWSTDPTFATITDTATRGANVTTYTTGNVPRFTTFYFRVRAENAVSPSAWSDIASVVTP